MKLLVFSDTHNDPERMPIVLESEENVTACFFLGDGSADADVLQQRYPAMPLYRVAGNCDLASLDPLEGLAAFGGLLFFYTHGHTYGVKYRLDSLSEASKTRGANVVLFGHTHVPFLEYVDNLYLFNPGSLSEPRMGGPTYGRISIENYTPRFEICDF